MNMAHVSAGFEMSYYNLKKKKKKPLETRLTLRLLAQCVHPHPVKALPSAYTDQLLVTPRIVGNALVFWSISGINLK